MYDNIQFTMHNSFKIPALLTVLAAIIFSVLATFKIYREGKLPNILAKASKEESVLANTKTNSDLYRKTLRKFYVLDKDLKFNEPTESAYPIEIKANNALVLDLSEGEILFEKDLKERVPIASLVKIMTTIIALEHKDTEDEMTVSEKAGLTGENSMEITAGETYTLRELLYGLILHSGNDAAVAIAENTAESEENFVEWMNIKAGELGLSDTKFYDASGLNDNSYSTAYDLAKLTRYAMKNPDFKEVVKTLEYEILPTEKHKYIYLYNQTNLLRSYPGVEGVKTGFTEEAGLCLVTYVKYGDKELIGVVLGSSDRKYDMVLMLDYAFEKLGIKADHPLITVQ